MSSAGGRWTRLRRAAALMRPAVLAEHARLQAHLPAHLESLRGELRTVRAQTRQLAAEVARLTLREEQLRVVLDADATAEERVAAFRAGLDEAALAAHVRQSIARAALHLSPFPYCVVDDLLPKPYYQALLAAIPPAPLFAERAVNRQQLLVPLGLAPKFSKVVWAHMTAAVAGAVVGPALAEKFRDPLAAWLRCSFPAVADPLAAIHMHCSDGRIMLRRPGYRIPPHRDPKWGFITCLFYLARPGDNPRWGTQLFSVSGDDEAIGGKPHWVTEERCRCEVEVDFLPNRAVVFLNSRGAHGAHIPADASPDLERYTYQFRVGPTRESLEALRSTLPPERQALWSGKVTSY